MSENCNKIAELAGSLTYSEWLKVRFAIDRAFEDKERSARKQLKADAERIVYHLNHP